MLLNWGKQSIPSGGNAPGNSTFPLAYKTKCLQVVTNTKLDGGDGLKCIGVSSMTKTYIAWDCRYVSDSGRTGTQRYLAIGS